MNAKKASLLFIPWIGMLLLAGCLLDSTRKAGPSNSFSASGNTGGTATATTAPGNSPQDSASATSLLNGTVRAILPQADGKTVLGGDFHPPNYVMRLHSDGSMDAEFEQNIGTGFNAPVFALALAVDGGILAGGEFSDFGGMFASRIVRLNPDGTLDNDFRMNLGQGFNDKVSSIAVQGDGKILVAGNFTEFNGVAAVRVARLNADGTLDSSYGVPSPPPDTTPPAAPTAWDMKNPKSGLASKKASPDISGNAAENSAVVSVWVNNASCTGAALGTATVAGGVFTISSFTLSGAGLKTFYYRIADTLGNGTACAPTGLWYTLTD